MANRKQLASRKLWFHKGQILQDIPDLSSLLLFISAGPWVALAVPEKQNSGNSGPKELAAVQENLRRPLAISQFAVGFSCLQLA